MLSAPLFHNQLNELGTFRVRIFVYELNEEKAQLVSMQN